MRYQPPLRRCLVDRVIDSIEVRKPSECWPSTINHLHKRYRQFLFRRKFLSLHRLVFLLNNGRIPEGNVVMHLCNNTLCLNPSHLSTGTQKDNREHAAKTTHITRKTSFSEVSKLIPFDMEAWMCLR